MGGNKLTTDMLAYFLIRIIQHFSIKSSFLLHALCVKLNFETFTLLQCELVFLWNEMESRMKESMKPDDVNIYKIGNFIRNRQRERENKLEGLLADIFISC